MTIEIDEIKREERLVVELLNTAIHILKHNEKINIRVHISNFGEANEMEETRWKIKQRIDLLDVILQSMSKAIRIMDK